MSKITPFLLLVFLAAWAAQAQETSSLPASPPPDNPAEGLESTYASPAQLPGIFVTDLQVENAANVSGEIKGTFVLLNNDKRAYSGLKYVIELLGPAPVASGGNITADNALIYDRTSGSTAYTLAAGEKKVVSLTYNLPAVPDGDYRLRVKTISSQREELGWADANIFSPAIPDSGYVVLESGSIKVGSSQTQTPPLGGTTVSKNDAISFNYVARNVGSKTMSATPRLRIYRYLGADSSPAQELKGQAISLVLDQPVSGQIAAPATALSGPYYAVLDFAADSNQVISGLFEYRWVVEGPYAKILSVSFTKLTGQKNENLTLAFDLAGRTTDGSSLLGNLEVDLLDQGQKVQTVSSEQLNLQNAANNVEVTFALERSLSRPEIKARLKSTDGSVLDEQNISFEVPNNTASDAAPSSGKGLAAIMTLLAAAVMALLSFGAWKLWSNRRPPSIPPVTPLIILIAILLITGLFAAHQTLADSQGITVNSGARVIGIVPFPNLFVQLFINAPEHQGDYQPTQIPVSFTAKDRLCGCFPLGQYVVDISYAPNGGWLENYVPPSQLTHVTRLESDWLRLVPFGPAFNWTGSISIPPQTPYKTTLQFYGRHYLLAEDGPPVLTSWHVIHVFLGQETEPSPQPTPPANGCLQALKQISSAVECSTDNVRLADITLTLRNICGPTQNGVPLDVVIVFDRSGSMNDDTQLSDAKTAARTLIDELDPATDRVSLVTYSNSGQVDEELTQDFSAVRRAINRLDADGRTNIGDGVFAANQELQRRGRPGAAPIMIVLTDGIANGSHSGAVCEAYPRVANQCTRDAINQADAAKESGVTVFTVGFGLNELTSQSSPQVLALARATLQSMASSLDHFFEPSTGQQLIEALRSIGEQITSGDIVDAVITDILPPNVQYAGNALPEPLSINGQELVWNVGTIGANQTATIRFKVSFNADTIGQLIDADIFPNSRVDYTDSSSQDQSTPFPLTRVSPERCSPSQCSDLLDNDSDSAIDCADPGCWVGDTADTCNPSDNDEQHIPVFDPGAFQETD